MSDPKRSDKWHFLKVVDGLAELDRVRRQHQLQLQTEDDGGIVFRCRASAACPYRMAFYHAKNAIYIRNTHNHDAIVPIVGSQTTSDEHSGTKQPQQPTLARLMSVNLLPSSEDETEEDEDKAGDEAEETTTTTAMEVDNERGNDEDEEWMTPTASAAGGGRQSGRATRRRRVQFEASDGTEEEDDAGNVPNSTDQPKRRHRPKRMHFKNQKKVIAWRLLGKISGNIGDVCRRLCQVHFVRKHCCTRNGDKIWFRCLHYGRSNCKYKAMISTKQRLLYCRSTHNHPVTEEEAASSLSAAAVAANPPHSDNLSPSTPSSSSPSKVVATASCSSSSSYCDYAGNKWFLLANRVFTDQAIAQVCRLHMFKQFICRPTRVYLCCARLGNACAYRANWHRNDGCVYFRRRQWHEYASHVATMGDKSQRCGQCHHQLPPSSAEQQVDKMPLAVGAASCSSSVSVGGAPPAPSFVDKLGKTWTFLAQLDGTSAENNGTSKSAVVRIPLEQQLEQLCAERHLSRTRLLQPSSSTRIWLHCAQHRQPEVPCPYRVVVHLPEGTAFHRLRHNHAVPYNLSSDIEKANGTQMNGGGGGESANPPKKKKRTSATALTTTAVASTSSSGPATRSSTAKNCGDNATNVRRRGRPQRMAFVKARKNWQSSNETGHENDEEREATPISAASTDTDEHEEVDHNKPGQSSPRPNTRHFAKRLCSSWPRTEVRIKRDAFVKARASISSGLQTEEQIVHDQPPPMPPASSPPHAPTVPRIYKFAKRNWHLLADNIGDRRALALFCRTNMLRVAGGVITNSYRNRMLCIRSACPFRALWLNRQGLVYGQRRHNHNIFSAQKIPPVVKEEPVELKLEDFVKEFESLALRLSLHFNIDNDLFVLMPRAEVGDQWISRLLMLRDEETSIRLAEFTGSQEAFSEKVEHWQKTDFAGGHQKLIDAINAKCADYFQQSPREADPSPLGTTT